MMKKIKKKNIYVEEMNGENPPPQKKKKKTELINFTNIL